MRSALVSVVFLAVAVPVWANGDPATAVAALGSPSAGARARARAVLVAAGPKATDALAAGLKSDDPLVVAGSADLVGTLSLRPLRDVLHDLAGDAKRPMLVRQAACRALGKVGDSRDLALLVDLSGRIPDAAIALVALEDKAALKDLAKLLRKGDASPEVAYAVASFGDEAGIRALLADLDAPGEVRLGALRYLRKLSGRDPGTDRAAWKLWWRREKLARALGNLDWDKSETALKDVLAREKAGGPDAERLVADLVAIAADTRQKLFARTKSILALGLMRVKSANEPLLSLLQNDSKGQIRLYAAEALGRIGVAKTMVDLAFYLINYPEPFRLLSTKPEGTRYFTIDSEVCKSLLENGIKGGLDVMIRHMREDHRVRVYQEAVRTARLITGQNFDFRPDAPTADRLAAASRWRVWFDDHRSSLTLPLPANYRDDAFRARVRQLVGRLDDFHFLDMWKAKETLAILGESALPELLAGLERPEEHIRVDCARLIGRIHAQRARGQLAEHMTDPSEKPAVRAAAAWALAEMGPGDAVNSVIDALRDPSADVRIQAARALAKAKFSDAVPAIRRALASGRTPSKAFLREAYYALGAHGDKDAIDKLAGLLSDPDTAFRRLVANRLWVLTDDNPTTDPKAIAEWRAKWKVSRSGYTPPKHLRDVKVTGATGG